MQVDNGRQVRSLTNPTEGTMLSGRVATKSTTKRPWLPLA